MNHQNIDNSKPIPSYIEAVRISKILPDDIKAVAEELWKERRKMYWTAFYTMKVSGEKFIEE